jgi:hypothetical protein
VVQHMEFQNFWTIIKCVIAKMVSVGPLAFGK